MNINEEFKLEMLEAKDKEVFENINSYFRENEMNYEVVKLYRKSNRKNDWYLYVVVARFTNTQRYAVWTSWNDSIKCLNHGHYDITSIEDCMEVVDEYTTYVDECTELNILEYDANNTMKSDKHKRTGYDVLLSDYIEEALNKYSADNIDIIKDEESGYINIMYHSSNNSFAVFADICKADDIDMSVIEHLSNKYGIGYSN